MSPQQLINEITQRLVKVYSPLEIYLFNKEDWLDGEDPEELELTIIVPSRQEENLSAAGYEALESLGLDTHLVVLSKAAFDAMARTQDLTFLHIQKYGTKIYQQR